MEALTTAEFEGLAQKGALIVDTRNTELLKRGFIKGSIFLHTVEKIREYIWSLSPVGIGHSATVPVLLVFDNAEKEDRATQIQASGIENIKGYLEGSFEAWDQAGGDLDMIIDVQADELMMDIPFDENLVVVDVRPAISFGSGHLKDAISLPLAQINDPLRISAIEETDNLYIVGETEEDAFLAATILKKHDIHNLRVVLGGWEAVQSEKKAKIVNEPGMLN